MEEIILLFLRDVKRLNFILILIAATSCLVHRFHLRPIWFKSYLMGINPASERTNCFCSYPRGLINPAQ